MSLNLHIPTRIVREYSVTHVGTTHPKSLAKMMEEDIEHHRENGFMLESWQYSATETTDPATGHALVETIVAVFRSVQ